MTAWSRRAAPVLLVLGVLGAGCGAGGFSSAPPPPADRGLHHYVALGDGFTAAPHAGPTAGDDGCLRSSTNYPALVAHELGVTDVRDVSCTGATTRSLTTSTKPPGGRSKVPAQLDAIDRHTDLVTLGIGIEDDDLLDHLFRVCLVQPCLPGTAFYTQVLADVDRATGAVTDALRSIQAKAPQAYLVVVGYPRLTPPPENGCTAFPPQPPQADRDVVNYLLDDLNDKLRSAARQTGAAYVDVAALSADHVLCSGEPWVHGMDARPGRSVAYHPVAAEQRAVADQIVTQVRER